MDHNMTMNGSGMDPNMSMNGSMDGMSMGPMMPMPMFFYWTPECWFLFRTWATGKEENGYFALACVLVFIFNFVMYSLPYIQKKLFPISMGISKADTCHSTNLINTEKEEKEAKKSISDVFIGFVFFFFTFVMSCFNMLLLMTFNGYVVICVVLGASVGYLTGEFISLKKNSYAPVHYN